MVDPKLIALLRCPIDGNEVKLAEDSLVTRINDGIQRGEIRDRQEQKVMEPIDAGLVNHDGTRLYPIRGGIPTLVADEAIEVPNLG